MRSFDEERTRLSLLLSFPKPRAFRRAARPGEGLRGCRCLCSVDEGDGSGVCSSGLEVRLRLLLEL